MAAKRSEQKKYFPEIKFETTKGMIKPKEKVRLTWKVSDEEEIRFWSDTTDPCSQGPFDWNVIHGRGRTILPSGEITLSPGTTTSYFVTATSGAGFAGEKITIHVEKKERVPRKTPFECSISPEDAQRMVRSHTIRSERIIEKSDDIVRKIKSLIDSGGV